MGAEPPFLYDHPSKYSFSGPSDRGFNPKAVSQASLSLPTPKARLDGRLVNFKEINRHPDSYYAAPYGNLDRKAMSVHTKSRVKYARIVQLVLRICELIGAVGLLFCAICIKGIDATTGWILHVPPSIAILHTIYGTYHYSRSANGRTPSSSASYCIFAATIDAGLTPFFIFSVLISHTQSIEPVNAPGHWSTLFSDDEATMGIVLATFVTSVVTGTFQFGSLALSIYLGVIFRKISRLPPDMNPLEDNLTSRHKRSKSSLLDDCLSHSGTSTDKPQQLKAEDPLMASSTVPFMHTRNDSYSNITRISHPSARASRMNLSAPFYDQPPAHRSLHTKIRGPFYDLPLSQCSSRTEFQTQTIDRTRSSCDEAHSDLCNGHSLSTKDSVFQTDLAIPSQHQSLAHCSSRTETHGNFDEQHIPSHRSSRTMFPFLSGGECGLNKSDQSTLIRSPKTYSSIYSNNINPANQSSQSTITRSPTKSSSLYSTSTMTTTATSRPPSIRPQSTAPSLPDGNWITHPSASPSPSTSPPRELKYLFKKPSYQPLCQTSPFEYAINNESISPLEMNPPTPPPNKQKPGVEVVVEQRILTPGTGNLRQVGGPGVHGTNKTNVWGGMGRSNPARTDGGGRVISRSGVEVKEKGIYPNGGIRAREVSGKVMEEGRTENGGWT